MAEKILGIDAGTNSIGWGIVEYDRDAVVNKYRLIEDGVNIFQEGVKIEKGQESSRAAERTGYRRQRIGYWRRKTRKIRLLRILIREGFCPTLTDEQLKAWRSEKKYPLDDAFMEWQRTDEEGERNPYFCRNLCLTEKLNLGTDVRELTVEQRHNRYMLGRAIYHINQRRGFLSNRKEDTKESEGEVKKGMDELTKQMQDSGKEYLGQYFYEQYKNGGKIRNHYTSRLEHYEKELLKICEVQGLTKELTDELRKTIITQRPLKSQKHSVGKCVFEPSKSRCPISHPLYEQYRLYSFINNIKMQGPNDSERRPLTAEEKALIIPLFLRKSKKEFKFEDIAKKLSGSKKNFCYYKDKAECAFRFNYYMDTSVSGCPVTAQLANVFEAENDVDGWLEAACEVYTLAKKKNGQIKNRYEIMNDIWHALFFFEDKEKLKRFALEKLQLDEEHATMFSEIKIPSDYASLSLKAIRKILPYMKQYGLIYSHAVFMANLYNVIPCEKDDDAVLPLLPKEIADDVVNALNEYDLLEKNNPTDGHHTKNGYLKGYVACKYNLSDKGKRGLERLYHPSMVETFPKVCEPTAGGYYQLGSPRTNSMRNPMAMHSLFRLRHVINTLLKEGKIDRNTTIHIEFARELNDSNKRAAIRQWQNSREKGNRDIANEIKATIGREPTYTDIQKYRLWEEQNHICLYTGKQISLTELFDPNKFDIEHTIPRSVGGDSTDENFTICDSGFNRDVKRAQIPSQLANHEDILERISHWKENIDNLGQQIRKINTRGVSDKGARDGLIQKKHRLIMERDYWKGKYARFTMIEVPEGFSRRQGVDVSVISKYARLYLQSLFPNVYVVKSIATSDFRKIWGIQEEYTKKERVNHCHHAIDAIAIACIGKAEYDKLAQYYYDEERYRWGMASRRATFPKPWETFTEDIKHIEDSLLISHYTADNMGKRTRKKIREGGKFSGKYMDGDTARSSLHQDTYYGAIERDGEIKYVVRKLLIQLEEKDVEKIVDDVVRQKVKDAMSKYGGLKKAVEAGVWMNEEKGVKINKVRVYAHTTEPQRIRLHRDISRKEYKRSCYVVNDSNYIMGIYAGVDGKGREKRNFQLVNCLEASNHFNKGKYSKELLLSDKNGCVLKWWLKVGTMVLFYEISPNEICNLDKNELSKRLYKVYGMDKFGRIKLSYHQEARPSGEIPAKNGAFKQGEVIRPRIVVYYSQFNALVEGQDFKMNDIGEITFLGR